MKKFIVIVSAACASFTLTVLSSMIVFSQVNGDAAQRFAIRYVSSPLIALLVGILVGLVIRDGAKIVAALSLAPWALWVILATDWKVASPWHKSLTIASAFVYMVVGIGAAAFVNDRMAARGKPIDAFSRAT
jgi:hypothetical protein